MEFRTERIPQGTPHRTQTCPPYIGTHACIQYSRVRDRNDTELPPLHNYTKLEPDYSPLLATAPPKAPPTKDAAGLAATAVAKPGKRDKKKGKK